MEIEGATRSAAVHPSFSAAAVKKAAKEGVPYPAALKAAVVDTAKQGSREESSEPVSKPIADETPTNGGE